MFTWERRGFHLKATGSKESTDQPTKDLSIIYPNTMNFEEFNTDHQTVEPTVTEEVQGTEEANTEVVEQSTDQAQQPTETFEWFGRQLSKEEYVEESKRLAQDYTRKSQELAELRKSQELQQPKSVEPQIDPEQEVQLKEAAKALSPFLQEQLESAIQERVQTAIQQEQQRAAQRQMFLQELDSVKTYAQEIGVKYDDSVRDGLLEHMRQTGNANPMEAFKVKHFQAIVDHAISQQNKSKKEIVSTQGAKAPKAHSDSSKDLKIGSPEWRDYMAKKYEPMLGNS